MALYIQSNLTVFPSASALTTDIIRQFIWAGFSADTTDEQIIAAGYIPVVAPDGDQPSDTTLVVDKNQAGEYAALWMDNTDYHQAENDRNLSGLMRMKRNKLLQETDWTQGKDIADAVSSQWTTYRQALRDISNQAGFPGNIQWPEQPV